MPVDSTEVIAWVQVGSALIRTGVTEWARYRAAMVAAGVAADNATLDALVADYDERIARAEAAACPPVPPDGP